MAHFNIVDPLRAVVALDRKVHLARAALLLTSELHPDFERRVAELVELVDKRDRVLVRRKPCTSLPPAA